MKKWNVSFTRDGSHKNIFNGITFEETLFFILQILLCWLGCLTITVKEIPTFDVHDPTKPIQTIINVNESTITFNETAPYCQRFL